MTATSARTTPARAPAPGATGSRQQRLEQEEGRCAVGHHVNNDERERGGTPASEQQRSGPGINHHGPEVDDAERQRRGRVHHQHVGVVTAGVKTHVTIWSTGTSAGFRGNTLSIHMARPF
jgi:hypothetical protein